MKKARKKIYLFILIPILVLALAGGGAYIYLQTKLKAGGDSAKADVVNAMIKEVVTHPAEAKKMMDSVTVTAEDESITSSVTKETSTDTVNKSENASTGTTSHSAEQNAPTPNTSVSEKTETPAKSETAPVDSQPIFSTEYMKAHISEYDILSTGAQNLGGNTYHLTVTVKHKPTGKTGTVETTTQLSEGMKETLRGYRK